MYLRVEYINCFFKVTLQNIILHFIILYVTLFEKVAETFNHICLFNSASSYFMLYNANIFKYMYKTMHHVCLIIEEQISYSNKYKEGNNHPSSVNQISSGQSRE